MASNKNRWNKEELENFIKLYPTLPMKELEKIFNRDFGDIKRILTENNCDIKSADFWWTEEQLQYLSDNFETGHMEDICEHLGKKWKTVGKRAREMGLRRISKNGNRRPTPKLFTEDEIKFISDNYKTMSPTEMGLKLNRKGGTIDNFCKSNDLNGFRLRKNPKDYSDEYLLKMLIELSIDLGRCPSSTEIQYNRNFPSVDIYYDRFGGFSNACELAGLMPNTGTYGTVCYSKNGDRCYSISEQLITNYLIDNNIEYIKEYPYYKIIPNIKFGLVMDWYINKIYAVEFFGMEKFEVYNLKTKLKQDLCNKNNVNLISIFQKDLRNLDNIFNKFKNKNP